MARHKDISTIRAVVFDLDDTLHGEQQYVRSGYRAVADHLRKTFDRGDPFESWLWGRFLAGQTNRAFNALSERFGLDLCQADIDGLVKIYREHRPTIRPYEGAAEMLGRLHERYRLGLLSDGFLPAQQYKLEALKLGRFFDAIVFTEQLGRDAWKPSTKGFQAISRDMGVPHESCAYVADNPAKDFLAPNKLGWLSIQYLRPGQVHADKPAPEGGLPQVVVRSAGELILSLIR